MPKQFVYKKGNSEIIIPFEDNDSLKKELENLPEIISILSEKIPDLLYERKPKMGLEDLYRYTVDGNIELFKYPNSVIDKILLVLFLKHPELMTLKQINTTVGIANGKDYISHKSYKNYFRKDQNGIGLKPDAIEIVSTSIIPKLRELKTVSSEAEK